MQAADLVKYIEHPELLDKQSVEQLQKLVQDFPYFQSAHLLLSMASKKWDASAYQQSLKKTAIVAPNRAQLFQLIHRMETAMERELVEPPAKTTEPEQPVIAVDKQDSKQELDILKAAEMVTEQPAKEEPPVIEKPVPDAEALLEKEIEKGVVNAFVEKEILKTPELHKPKPKVEPESFADWLALMKKNNGQPNQVITERPRPQPKTEVQKQAEQAEDEKPQTGPGEEKLRKEKQKAIIDKIIEHNPGIIRNKEEQKFFSAELKARESLLESEHLVTETLARIYALQGSVNKAVRAYEILSLKFPQKSAYFATLIQKLKNNP